MFTLSDIRAEFDRLDAISGLNTKEVKIRISKRMTRRLGACRYRDNGQIVDIVLADYLCRYGSREDVMDTVRHEYAHLYTIVKDGRCGGHDARWKQVAVWLGASPAASVRLTELEKRMRADGAAIGGQPNAAPANSAPQRNTLKLRVGSKLFDFVSHIDDSDLID